MKRVTKRDFAQLWRIKRDLARIAKEDSWRRKRLELTESKKEKP